MVRAETTSSSPFEGFINGITVFLNNSPLNAGKKALAVAQAGQYDEAAVKAKVDKLIADNPVRHNLDCSQGCREKWDSVKIFANGHVIHVA
jgi:hypothetical protein